MFSWKQASAVVFGGALTALGCAASTADSDAALDEGEAISAPEVASALEAEPNDADEAEGVASEAQQIGIEDPYRRGPHGPRWGEHGRRGWRDHGRHHHRHPGWGHHHRGWDHGRSWRHHHGERCVPGDWRCMERQRRHGGFFR